MRKELVQSGIKIHANNVDDLVVRGREVWSRRRVISEFRDTMGTISGLLKEPLPLEDRAIFFVPKSTLIPKDPSARADLVSRYGSKILDDKIGDCTVIDPQENSAYRFMIRVGVAKTDYSHEGTLEVLAHEFGHTIGEFNKSTLLEEMKAFAFMALFMRIYTDTDHYLIDGLFPGRVHELAKHNIGIWQAQDIPEELMIARIIGQPFGRFNPLELNSGLIY